MQRFQYKGKSKEGKMSSGFIEAVSKEDAATKLRSQGYFIAQLKQAPVSSTASLFQPKGKVKAKTLALICRQLTIELNTGMSLVSTLQLQEEQATDKRLKKAFEEIRLDVASGTAFTKALEKHKDIFPSVFIYLVEAGEVAGVLPEVFDRLAIYYEREDELRKKITEALMYPGIISSVATIMVFLLVFFVLPMLISNFSQFGVKPPALTQAVLDFRLVLIQYWYVAIAVLVGTFYGIRYFFSTDFGKNNAHKVLLKLPVVGELQKMVIFSRFCRTLGLLLRSGISMIQSLNIVGRLMGNVIIARGISDVRLGVEKGQGLSTPLKQAKIFPAMLVQMVSVGEETGKLEEVLVQVSEYYDREVNFAVASFTKLLEPMVMILLAVVVLFILISVYLPMMEMMTQM